MAFCNNCKPRVKAFLKKIDKLLISNMSKAFEVTTVLKLIVNLKVWDSLTYLTKNNYDDKILLQLRNSLEYATNELFPAIQTKGKDVFDLLNALCELLSGTTKSDQDSKLIKIASLLTSDLDKRHSTAEYDAAVQTFYLSELK